LKEGEKKQRIINNFETNKASKEAGRETSFRYRLRCV